MDGLLCVCSRESCDLGYTFYICSSALGGLAENRLAKYRRQSWRQQCNIVLFGRERGKQIGGLTGLQTEPLRNATADSGYNSDESNGYFQPHTIPQQALQDRLDDFVDASNYALQSAYPKPQASGPPRYSKVSVLLIQWKEDDLGVSTELDKLYNVFSADYGYDCEDIFKIPEGGSQVALMTRLQSLIEQASRDHLLIIYYGGHSDDSSSQQSIWSR